MNYEQVMALARTALQIGGAVLVTKQVMTADQAATMQSQIMIAVGALVTISTTAWGIYKRSDKNLVKAARHVQETRDGTANRI